MTGIANHPLRYNLANELHARPFPRLTAPGRAAYMAIMPEHPRNHDAERAHLIELLDRYGADHPKPGATHYTGKIGKYGLKWESHTEFVAYTLLCDGAEETAFDPRTFDIFPADWLAHVPGRRVTSALLHVEITDNDEHVIEKARDWFVPESLAISRVLNDSLVIAADFRIDPAGHMRFALFARPDTGPGRIGRVVQRLCEIETYKVMSMLGFAAARDLSPKLAEIDGQLTIMTEAMGADNTRAEDTLHALLNISTELEKIGAQFSYRFAATGAYETIVNQRISVLRETHFGGRQTFCEFMMRRFDPAMRTVKSTETRLAGMSARALRAGDLLRTRVDVERSAQNQALLESMDRRADLQLRLQQTVEGLSVVAISSYVLNLMGYIFRPLTKSIGVDISILTAVTAPVVIGAVWLMVRRIRKSMH